MRRRRLVSCESGSTAVEAAFVLPPFLMLILGILSACVVIFAASSLHYAVEGAARCYSVNSVPCSAGTSTQCCTNGTTQSYAQSLYLGPSSPAPTFSASTPSCGHQVSATLNYVLSVGVAHWTIPFSATACYP
jgi:Flp pilus assembly protein TadG